MELHVVSIHFQVKINEKSKDNIQVSVHSPFLLLNIHVDISTVPEFLASMSA